MNNHSNSSNPKDPSVDILRGVTTEISQESSVLGFEEGKVPGKKMFMVAFTCWNI